MIEIEEYVRTKSGKIDKVINNNYYMPQYIECEEGIVDKENIVNHSKDLVDLIEEGDYVNGEKVNDFKYDYYGENNTKHRRYAVIIKNTEEWEVPVCIREREIKSIVTHQQFKQVEYVLEE